MLRICRLFGSIALLVTSVTAATGANETLPIPTERPQIESDIRSQTRPETRPETRQATIAAIGDYFAANPTLAGEFIQFGPDGSQTGGVFYIQRPGKIRFNYEDPNPIKVISNGKTVAVNNHKLDTWDFYPLRKTPLAFLLGDEISVEADAIREVRNDEDLTTVVMGDDRVFGDAVITMMFDPETFDLRQWVIRDARGKETTVMIFNVQKNIDIPSGYFTVDERAIRQRQLDADR